MEKVLQEEIPEPQPLEVIEHRINHYSCPRCQKYIVARNNAPADRFGKNVLAHVTLLKYDDRLPLQKVVESIERHYSFPITDVGVMKITQKVSKRLLMPYQELIGRIRKAKAAYVDETEIKVDGKTYHLWTFVSDTEVVFVIRKSRGKDVLEEILGQSYQGVICCDGWTAYSNYSTNLQRCWAHLLREAKHFAEQYASFQGFYDSLKSIFGKIKGIREKPPNQAARATLKLELELDLQQQITQMTSYQEFRKFANKIQNGFDYWFTCITNLFVEPTNNIAERALRELIVQRKIMGGLRREKGARTMETISSMIATWKKRELSIFQTLKSFL
jgi:transposase